MDTPGGHDNYTASMRMLLLLSLVVFSTPTFAQSTNTPAQPKQSPPTTAAPAQPKTTPPTTTTPAPTQPKPRRAAAPAPVARTGIALTVTDAKGSPLEGIHVEISGSSTSSDQTNPVGQVNFPGLQAGTYRLRFTGDSVTAFEREVTLTAAKITNITITLNPAPPPKTIEKPAPAAPTPANVGPAGKPQLGSLTKLADRDRKTTEGRKETLLSCSGNTRNMMLVLTELQSERIYENAEATFYVVAGQGSAHIGTLESVIEPGSFIAVPRGTKYSLARQGKNPLVLLWTLSGEPCEQAR